MIVPRHEVVLKPSSDGHGYACSPSGKGPYGTSMSRGRDSDCWVPAKIATKVSGRASVGETYELRAVQVSVPECEAIGLEGGWPNGDRPREAKHPSAGVLGSKLVDTHQDIQIDPATLPGNIALLRDLDNETL